MTRSALLALALALAACQAAPSPIATPDPDAITPPPAVITPPPSPVAPTDASAGTGGAIGTLPPGSQLGAPFMLGPDAAGATVPLGAFIVFALPDPATWRIAASPEGIVTVRPGSDDGQMVTSPGAQAIAAGTVIVTLTDPAGEAHEYEIVVTP